MSMGCKYLPQPSKIVDLSKDVWTITISLTEITALAGAPNSHFTKGPAGTTVTPDIEPVFVVSVISIRDNTASKFSALSETTFPGIKRICVKRGNVADLVFWYKRCSNCCSHIHVPVFCFQKLVLGEEFGCSITIDKIIDRISRSPHENTLSLRNRFINKTI